MAESLDAIAARLFAGVMAPLVSGGAVAPGHAIGARRALALGDRDLPEPSALVERVRLARLRSARRLAPVDAVPGPRAADWALSAALHDLLQAANPTFDAALRRSAAERILVVAAATIDAVAPPATVGEALLRHTWLGRFLDVARVDTAVTWWLGSKTFRGIDPPQRLMAWPDLRRVNVMRTPTVLLDLEPLAVDRAGLTDAVTRLLTRTPLTDIATCARPAPGFFWTGPALSLLATRAGSTLAARALRRLGGPEVDAALGRATRSLLDSEGRALARHVVDLLAERAIAAAQAPAALVRSSSPDADFARGLGAWAAATSLASGSGPWSSTDRQRLLAALSRIARPTVEVRSAHALGLSTEPAIL